MKSSRTSRLEWGEKKKEPSWVLVTDREEVSKDSGKDIEQNIRAKFPPSDIHMEDQRLIPRVEKVGCEQPTDALARALTLKATRYLRGGTTHGVMNFGRSRD